MHRSGCGSVNKVLVREKRAHPCVQAEPNAKEVSVSVLRDMVAPSATDQCAPKIVE